MERLPDEILLHIFKLVAVDVMSLLRLEAVCRRFKRIVDDLCMWHHVFHTNYPTWASQVSYARSAPLIDWRDYVIHVEQQNRRAKSFSFAFVSDETAPENQVSSFSLRTPGRKRKLRDQDMTQQQEHLHSTPSNKAACRQRSPSLSNFALRTEPSSSSSSNHENISSIPSTSYLTSITMPSDIDFPMDSFTPNTLDRLLRDAHNEMSDDDPLPRLIEDPFADCSTRYYPPAFRIQDPLVADIDRVTNKGIVATGKHRKGPPDAFGRLRQSEHKILFWEYPSWRLVREFDVCLSPAETSCQITGLQTIRMSETEKVRLFTLAIGFPDNDEADSEDRVDTWRVVLIYRLFDNGDTQCVAHLNVDGDFVGREIFFFSDISWAQSNDGDQWIPDQKTGRLREWMRVVSPRHAEYDSEHTVFMLIVGPTFEPIHGYGQLIRFDIRGHPNILDPSKTLLVWDGYERCFKAEDSFHIPIEEFEEEVVPASVVTTVHLGQKVSCIIHFRYPPHLNHLVCVGSYKKDELTLYDWRFGVKVGVLPWKSQSDAASCMQNVENVENVENVVAPVEQMDHWSRTVVGEDDNMPDFEDDDGFFVDDDDDDDDMSVARPWGLESTMVLPPFWSVTTYPCKEDLARHGLRLIAVGDDKNDKLEIKVWDISYLLRVNWDPLMDKSNGYVYKGRDWTNHFYWWKRGSLKLKCLAVQMLREMDHPSTRDEYHKRLPHFDLPYSPPDNFQSMILVHTFDSRSAEDTDMPVKYTAYNVLRTSLFLLTEEGKVTVMDIETGEVIGKVDNIAASSTGLGSQRHVKGIDVNVVGGSVVVTSRQGILRSATL
ncbi:hypothetical protein EC973_007956 [Apophysomyces ossiformis]|uniref:F-box domain-containing protein n=1 Tax=Apophysomyces ossiformis TaxID=679940 RepID=A0A8H7BLP8_9FUNG|nr:hypothetical protein EC973_007956 [Apophysomyces ossiformis]